MCMNTEEWVSTRSFGFSTKTHRSKRSKVRVYLLMRRRSEQISGRDMELKNLRLYLENQSIIEENEKLRKKANVLYQEKLVLVSELQKKFPPIGCSPPVVYPIADSVINKEVTLC
ncbi:protein LITTLE ZIPPER 2-like [Punica granatum]|uniref:Uncharacterized protein n=2 Tax=Punica granatum TaxID=22663 RepID=A0A2I0J0P9_PUNGR|nr:protein LITTLE ZIPPER 2-like [Punica granatum]PKI49510.1 hypothetical protein CRG98_030127 [Punica granatum]